MRCAGPRAFARGSSGSQLSGPMRGTNRMIRQCNGTQREWEQRRHAIELHCGCDRPPRAPGPTCPRTRFSTARRSSTTSYSCTAPGPTSSPRSSSPVEHRATLGVVRGPAHAVGTVPGAGSAAGASPRLVPSAGSRVCPMLGMKGSARPSGTRPRMPRWCCLEERKPDSRTARAQGHVDGCREFRTAASQAPRGAENGYHAPACSGARRAATGDRG